MRTPNLALHQNLPTAADYHEQASRVCATTPPELLEQSAELDGLRDSGAA